MAGGGGRAEVPEGDVPGIFSFFSTMCSVPAVHTIQQVPLPSWFQFESSHREPSQEIKYRRRVTLVVHLYPQLPTCKFTFRQFDPSREVHYSFTSWLTLCHSVPLGSGNFTFLLSFRLWVVTSLAFGVPLHTPYIESFNHFLLLLYKTPQTQ